MEPVQTPVNHLVEGDVIQDVGYVINVTQMASGIVVDVRIAVLDKLATIAWEPTWVEPTRNEDGTYHGAGWSWPTVPVSGKVT